MVVGQPIISIVAQTCVDVRSRAIRARTTRSRQACTRSRGRRTGSMGRTRTRRPRPGRRRRRSGASPADASGDPPDNDDDRQWQRLRQNAALGRCRIFDHSPSFFDGLLIPSKGPRLLCVVESAGPVGGLITGCSVWCLEGDEAGSRNSGLIAALRLHVIRHSGGSRWRALNNGEGAGAMLQMGDGHDVA